MTLKEVVERYSFGNNDFDLIKIFFKVNNCEEQAVDMLTEFAKNVIKKEREHIWFLKEHSRYGHILMLNEKVDLKDRIKLMDLHQSYINMGCLEKDSLNKAKEIFDKYGKDDFIAIDIYFLGYLQRNGIALYMHDCTKEINKREEENKNGEQI